MSLFQKSVEKKYLSELDSNLTDEKYQKFLTYFGNSEIQENIRNAKEEQFQEGFLRELFVKILDYTLNPEPQFNLTTEFKNVDDSKKADGAILSGEDAIAIIELKSTGTTDLDKVEVQAFGYKHHQPKCVYVIISNFEKLRFYIENAVDYIEFDLFNLTKDQFGLLWLCLSKESVLNNLPLSLKKSSVLQEENITKKLYADYSKFREQIFGNIVENNPDFDPLLLFNKTQKLLDRFLFIFFAEDRLLLPPNSISEIVKQWTTLKDELDEYIPLYDRFKKYFGYLNTGYKGKKYDIFPYNGGLFLPDEILDSITIDDDILHEHTLKLSAYDFETDVDVNILGHIFEHSLSEIENVQARLRGEEVDKAKTKRKKDGIFYTPKYITKYIVENTVGRLCGEKRQELGIVDEEYSKGRKNRRKDIVKALDEKLIKYREWLLSLTILDPACGSGAFLNQALDFLIHEHGKTDELRAQLLGGAIVFSDITTDILERNIYGVDLNEESVEIAKLSLWLRTAQKGRKLNTLSNNIKCGNSLIDDSNVAGDKAFIWHDEFPEVFEMGGFDIVIGNPPYGASFKEEEEEYFKQCYNVGNETRESYALFFERSFQLLKNNRILSFITPDTLLRKPQFQTLRYSLLTNETIVQLVETGPVFQDARDTWVLISVFVHNKAEPDHKIVHRRLSRYIVSVEERLAAFGAKLWDNDAQVSQLTWFKKREQIIGYLAEEKQQKVIDKLSEFKRLSDLSEISISRGEEGSKSKFSPDENGDLFMVTPEEVSMYHCREGWRISSSNLAQNKLNNLYQKPKIWIIRIQKMRWQQRIVSTRDERGNSAALKTLQVIVSKDSNQNHLKLLQAIFSSKLLNFWCVNYLTDDNNSTYLGIIPIPTLESVTTVELVERLELKEAELNNLSSGFTTFLYSKLAIDSLSRRLKKWHENDFSCFITELRKLKIQINISEEAEWMHYFDSQKGKVSLIKNEIIDLNDRIDKMVYELYDLSEEEIKIVEESI